MRRSLYISLVAILFLLMSCEETIEWKNEASLEPQIVVEGLLTNELKRHEVKLSWTSDDLSASFAPVDDALVFINDGTNTFQLTQDPDRKGIYLTDSIRALFGKVYILGFVQGGNEYFSAAASGVGAPMDDLVVRETEGGDLEYIYEESDSPSMMEVIINWNDNSNENDIHAFYYTLNVLDINKVFAPEKEKIIFPKGASVFRRKYSLSQPHQDFLRSLLSEVDWRGGLFDVAPGEVATNMSEGAIGFFAVSMVVTSEHIAE